MYSPNEREKLASNKNGFVMPGYATKDDAMPRYLSRKTLVVGVLGSSKYPKYPKTITNDDDYYDSYEYTEQNSYKQEESGTRSPLYSTSQGITVLPVYHTDDIQEPGPLRGISTYPVIIFCVAAVAIAAIIALITIGVRRYIRSRKPAAIIAAIGDNSEHVYECVNYSACISENKKYIYYDTVYSERLDRMVMMNEMLSILRGRPDRHNVEVQHRNMREHV